MVPSVTLTSLNRPGMHAATLSVESERLRGIWLASDLDDPESRGHLNQQWLTFVCNGRPYRLCNLTEENENIVLPMEGGEPSNSTIG